MTFTISPTQRYVIDWDKVQTLDDIKRVIAELNISISNNCESIDNIRDLVKLEDWSIGRMD